MIDDLNMLTMHAVFDRSERRSAQLKVQLRPSLKKVLQVIAKREFTEFEEYIEEVLKDHVEEWEQARQDGTDLRIKKLREARERLRRSGFHDPAAEPRYKVNERVFHKKYGCGRVSEVSGNCLTIDFEKGDRMRIMDSFVTLAEASVVSIAPAAR
jgi:hypothetical protein